VDGFGGLGGGSLGLLGPSASEAEAEAVAEAVVEADMLDDDSRGREGFEARNERSGSPNLQAEAASCFACPDGTRVWLICLSLMLAGLIWSTLEVLEPADTESAARSATLMVEGPA
jgi:hypothetical protein